MYLILMTQNKNQNIYLDTNNLYVYVMFTFHAASKFRRINPKIFNSNKYSSNSLKGCVLEVDLEYPKELYELNNDYPLDPEKKTEIKEKMLS